MRHRALAVATLGVLLQTIAVPWAGAVPSPVNSIVPPCFVGCPAGDVAFTVIVRDAANNPHPATVALDFSSCPEVSFCATQEAGTTISGSTASRDDDASGVASFHLRIGSLCPSGHVRVTATGLLLADRPVANLDQDGNRMVDATDQSIATAKVGGADHSADFDCDGDVDSADLAILATHVGHVCDVATPTLPRSWGFLKILYR
jgi:hypothetical protein